VAGVILVVLQCHTDGTQIVLALCRIRHVPDSVDARNAKADD
jgi:hypothetical protein